MTRTCAARRAAPACAAPTCAAPACAAPRGASVRWLSGDPRSIRTRRRDRDAKRILIRIPIVAAPAAGRAYDVSAIGIAIIRKRKPNPPRRIELISKHAPTAGTNSNTVQYLCYVSIKDQAPRR